MMLVTIWSTVEDENVEVEFTDDQYAAMTAFVAKKADEGGFFTAQEVSEHMPEPHNESCDFDTVDIVSVFLPDGYAVEMHGFDDFCVVPSEE